jgi:formylglycine-generating enzyme required for sulfatase activity
VLRDCPECPEVIVMAAGAFAMGSPDDEREREANEGPQRKVSIAKPFAIGRAPVTFEEYDACVAAGGCPYRPNDGGWGRGRQPAIHISWDDARSYLAWLSGKTGKAYRLPSEAEWEYAARGGTTTRYSWGDQLGSNRANCSKCGSRWDGKRPAPVGSFAATPFGLLDMHGNVWQWVEDCWHDSYRGAPDDGSAWTAAECPRRTLRGGAFFSYPKSLRSAYRYAYEPKGRLGNIGFRVARGLE